MNSPYRDFLKAHTREVMETLPTDGLFFDIVQPTECSCAFCSEKMEAAGLEPSDPEARRRFGLEAINEFKLDMTGFVRSSSEDCTIFYNAGHVGPRHRPVAGAYSHFELETLPSGGWGYLHFPVTARYARTLGLPYLGQTGKFHTSWGDFHSFKNLAALQYECFRMLALGAKCIVGDQLHPTGKTDPHVYDLIGKVYAEVEEKEPWCSEAKGVAEIAVLTPEEFTGGSVGNLPSAIKGVTRVLEEGAHQFDVVDSESSLPGYSVVVLPDDIPGSPELAEKLDVYLSSGGAVISSFASGMDHARKGFVLESLGVTLQGEGPRDLEGRLARGCHYPSNDFCEYVLPQGEIGRGLPETEHAMYMRGMEVTTSGGEVLLETVPAYFDRRYRHFCSHRQTPASGGAVVRNGQSIYFSHPIFAQYERNAPRWCKRLFLNALDLLLPEPLVRHDGPTTLQVAVNEQELENRRVLHLLHYIPERRGEDFDVMEDVIPLHGVRLSVRAPAPVGEVVLVPQKEPLAFEQVDGRVEFVLPRLHGHQMISLGPTE